MSNTFIATLRDHYEVEAVYWVSAGHDAAVHPAQAKDFRSVEDLDPPDIVIIEGFLFAESQPRIPERWLTSLVEAGAQALLISAHPERTSAVQEGRIFPLLWETPSDGANYIVAHDELAAVDHNPRFLWCGAEEVWGAPPYARASYEGLRGVAVHGAHSMAIQGDILATTGPSAKRLTSLDNFEEHGLPIVWGQSRARGVGHVVTLSGSVTSDYVLEHCPENVRWVLQLITALETHSRVLGKRPPGRSLQFRNDFDLAFLIREVDESTLADIDARWGEAQLCYDAGAILACIIMLGSVLEAVLRLRVERVPRSTLSRTAAPKKSDALLPVAHFSLSDLIRVARELQLLRPTSADYADRVREYRNFVHATKGPTTTFSAVDAERVDIVVREVLEDLRTTVDLASGNGEQTPTPSDAEKS